MKRIISLLLIAIFMLASLSVSAESEIKVILDGEEIRFDQPPVIISDRTMVPVRAIYEALGAEVLWDAPTRTASGTKMGVTVAFTIDEPTVVINYTDKAIDAPATIVNDRTLVPVRALAEGFGVDVQWDASARTVTLTDLGTLGTLSDYKAGDDTYNYEGQLTDGVPKGFGTGEIKGLFGTYFKGTWENGIPAVGRLYTADSSAGFTGFVTYDHGNLNGYSEITLTSGEVYRGNWANGAMSGYGEIYFTSGDCYKGNFENNTMHGRGEYHFADGDYFAGTFAYGNIDGYGEYYYADGSWYKGNWVDGVEKGAGTLYDATTGETKETLDGIVVE